MRKKKVERANNGHDLHVFVFVFCFCLFQNISSCSISFVLPVDIDFCLRQQASNKAITIV